MTPQDFAATDWKTAPKHAIYRDKVYPIIRHAKREKLLCLGGVYHPRGEDWVRCENIQICHDPHLLSTCHDSPVTTIQVDLHPTYHQCAWCYTACKTKEANQSVPSAP